MAILMPRVKGFIANLRVSQCLFARGLFLLHEFPLGICQSDIYCGIAISSQKNHIGFTAEPQAFSNVLIKRLQRSGEDKRSDAPVAHDTSQVAYESNPSDMLHVPTEGNLLQTHDHHTSGRADDEH